MIFLPHVNLIGLIYTAHYVCYIVNTAPTFSNSFLNDVLCYMSSMVWLIVGFLRMYSIVLLASYRYTAVFYINFHRVLTRSSLQMAASIALTWTVSIIMSFILKYAFQTTYSIFYCFQGYSDDINVVTWFMVVNNFLSVVIPSVLIAVCYVRILQKVKQLNKHVSRPIKVVSPVLPKITAKKNFSKGRSQIM